MCQTCGAVSLGQSSSSTSMPPCRWYADAVVSLRDSLDYGKSEGVWLTRGDIVTFTSTPML